MRRDLVRIERAVPLLARDLTRSLGPEWSIKLLDGPVVRVTDGKQVDVRQPVEMDFDLEDVFPPGFAEADGDQVLVDEAVEAVATAMEGAVLEVGNGRWPGCAEHRTKSLTVCSGLWVCSTGHDIAEVGELPPAPFQA